MSTDFHGTDVTRFWEISGDVPSCSVLLHNWTDTTLWQGLHPQRAEGLCWHLLWTTKQWHLPLVSLLRFYQMGFLLLNSVWVSHYMNGAPVVLSKIFFKCLQALTNVHFSSSLPKGFSVVDPSLYMFLLYWNISEQNSWQIYTLSTLENSFIHPIY